MTGKLSLIASALVLCSNAAGAQLPPEQRLGSRIPVPPVDFARDEARKIMRDFAECSVKKRPALAHEMVLDVSKYSIDKKYLVAADPSCLAAVTPSNHAMVQLSLGPNVFRSAFAEVLIKRNLAGFDPLKIREAAPLTALQLDPNEFAPKPGRKYDQKTLEQLGVAKRTAQNDVALGIYGECVVRTYPLNSRRLLDTKVNSKDESAVFEALMPAFNGCLDKGAQFSADRLVLRGTLSWSFYRLAYASRASSTQKVTP